MCKILNKLEHNSKQIALIFGSNAPKKNCRKRHNSSKNMIASILGKRLNIFQG